MASQARRPLHQVSVWISAIVLLAVVYLLLRAPDLGLKVLWSAVIFAAPMLFLLLPAFWMSICPLATLQALPRRLGLQPGRRIAMRTQVTLGVVAWALLLLLVPLRHPIFNMSGTAATAAIVFLGFVALAAGSYFQGMGGWCAGICPIRPVEVLYGQFTLEHQRPETCRKCSGCQRHCPWVSTVDTGEQIASQRFSLWAALGFPGFVLGYFLVEDGASAVVSYAWVWGGWLASMALFYLLGTVASLVVRLRTAALLAFAVYYVMSVPDVAVTWELGPAGALLLAVPPTAAMIVAAAAWAHRTTAGPVRQPSALASNTYPTKPAR